VVIILVFILSGCNNRFGIILREETHWLLRQHTRQAHWDRYRAVRCASHSASRPRAVTSRHAAAAPRYSGLWKVAVITVAYRRLLTELHCSMRRRLASGWRWLMARPAARCWHGMVTRMARYGDNGASAATGCRLRQQPLFYGIRHEYVRHATTPYCVTNVCHSDTTRHWSVWLLGEYGLVNIPSLYRLHEYINNYTSHTNHSLVIHNNL